MTFSFRAAGLALAGLTLLATGPAGAAELQDTLARISETGRIVIGHREASRPFSFVDESGEPAGFSIDLCMHIVAAVKDKLGLADLSVEFVPVTPQSRIAAVVDGTIDIECGTTTVNLSRQEQVDFTNMIFVSGATFLTTVDGKINAITDLAGKRIAVARETTTEQVLDRILRERGISADVVRVGDHDEGLAALESGEVDAYSSDRIVLIGLGRASSDPSRLVLVDRFMSHEPYAFMVTKGDADFRLVANRALAQVYRSGEINDVIKRWFGDLGGKTGGLLQALYILFSLSD